MTIAQLNTLYSEAISALDAGDYDIAINKAMAIQARLITTPNINRSLAGGGNQSISWTPQSIDSFIQHCRSLKIQSLTESSGPFQQTPVTYEGAS